MKKVIVIILFLLFLPSGVYSSSDDLNEKSYQQIESIKIRDGNTYLHSSTAIHEYYTPIIPIHFNKIYPFPLNTEDVKVECNGQPLLPYLNFDTLIASGYNGYIIEQVPSSVGFNMCSAQLLPTGKSKLDIFFNQTSSGLHYSCTLTAIIKDDGWCLIKKLNDKKFRFLVQVENDFPLNLELYRFSVTIPEGYNISKFNQKNAVSDKTETFIQWEYGDHFSTKIKRPPNPIEFQIDYEDPSKSGTFIFLKGILGDIRSYIVGGIITIIILYFKNRKD